MEKIVKTNSQGVIEWIFNAHNNNGTIYDIMIILLFTPPQDFYLN